MKIKDKDPEHLTHKKFFGGKKLTGILLVIFLLAFAIFLFTAYMPNVNENETEIAVLLPLSGPSSEAGLIYKKGIDMAVSEIRESGKNISVRYFDTEADPNKALDAFFTAVDTNIPAVLGPLTTAEAEVIAPYAEMYKKTILTYATGSSLDNYIDYVFHFDPSNKNSAYATINILKKLGPTNLSVVWAETALGQSIYSTIDEIAEKNNITIVSIPITTAEEVVSNIKDTDIPMVFVAPDTAEQLYEILHTYEQTNELEKLWISTDNGFGTCIRDNYTKTNLFVLVPTISTVDPLFIDNYNKRYNEPFDVSNGYMLYGYDSLMTIASALPIDQSNINSENIAENLRNYRYLGETGPVVFNENLERFPMYELYYPDNGTWVNQPIIELLDKLKIRSSEHDL